MLALETEIFRQTTGSHEDAYQLADSLFSDTYSLTRKQVCEIQNTRRGRRVEIQSLQERLREALEPERGEITHQLHSLQTQQFATRIIIERFQGKRF